MNEENETKSSTATSKTGTQADTKDPAPKPTVKKEKVPTLTFTSSMNFKEEVTDQDGKVVGNIRMVGVSDFTFTEVEGLDLTGVQHIAVGKRLASLEKAFGKLNLPS